MLLIALKGYKTKTALKGNHFNIFTIRQTTSYIMASDFISFMPFKYWNKKTYTLENLVLEVKSLLKSGESNYRRPPQTTADHHRLPQTSTDYRRPPQTIPQTTIKMFTIELNFQ